MTEAGAGGVGEREGEGGGVVQPIHLSWLLSVVSGMMLWLMGNKNKWGPRVGLLAQVLWLLYAVWLKQWGLLPGILAYTIIHARNTRRWR